MTLQAVLFVLAFTEAIAKGLRQKSEMHTKHIGTKSFQKAYLYFCTFKFSMKYLFKLVRKCENQYLKKKSHKNKNAPFDLISPHFVQKYTFSPIVTRSSSPFSKHLSFFSPEDDAKFN